MRIILWLICLSGLLIFQASNAQAQDNDRRARMQRRIQMQKNSRNQNRDRDQRGLKKGDDAPLFKLKSLDGKSTTDLSSFKGKRPVVLLFGSYT